MRHELAVAEHNYLKPLSLVRERAGVEALCVAVLMEARHEVFEVKRAAKTGQWISSLRPTRAPPRLDGLLNGAEPESEARNFWQTPVCKILGIL